MTETGKPDPDKGAGARNADHSWSLLLLALLLPLAVIVGGMSITYFEKGELLLTARGCRVMAHHGVTVQAIDEEGLSVPGFTSRRIRTVSARSGSIPPGDKSTSTCRRVKCRAGRPIEG
ncbi:hypothetical protein [Aromatoleum evansii]|uniref:hypothetical protein n=1 Tax=Aromatoleum evansii TaxID=59406 RepID=UPI00145DAB7E|nr:hypothetical protein [Aromatoleum evansii]NMG27979.1 hypothetical protein [Aromatoleum evansii]